MIDMQIMKLIGFYQFLHGPKAYGVFFRVCITIYLLFLPSILIMSLYYCSVNNINGSVHYLICLMSTILASFKINCFRLNIQEIWNCIIAMSTDRLSYEYHDELLLDMGRNKSKSYAIFFIFIWVSSISIWILSPFFLNEYVHNIKIGDNIYHYRYNTLNWILPVTDQFYNEHFNIYYVLETLSVICGVYCSIVFDVLLISFCVSIRYQLKTISKSYSTITDVHIGNFQIAFKF